MRSARRRSILRLVFMIQIPAHIPARNLQPAHQGNHNVRKILAHPAPRLERIVNRRIHIRAIGHVLKKLVQPGIQFLQQCERVSAASQFQLKRQLFQQLRRRRVLARQQHLPVIRLRHARVQVAPIAGDLQEQILRRQHVHNRLRRHFNQRMLLRNIKMVHRVAVKIAVHHHRRPRLYFQRKAQAALTKIRPRLHAYFHHAFPHRGFIPKTRNVPH